MTMKLVKPSSDEEKQTKTTTDTIELTAAVRKTWKSPPFQRQVTVNSRVRALAETIKANGGVLPGTITLGVVAAEVYVIDGLHRLEAFDLSGLRCGYVDVRMHFFTSLADAAREFIELNSSLVKMRPDDKMRAEEVASEFLQRIRRKCPFVGYDMIRRSERAPILSMAVLVRAWIGSRSDVPTTTLPTAESVAALTDTETAHVIEFVTSCYDAWGRDAAYARLWGSLNLVLCAWLYRRSVLRDGLSTASRSVTLTKEQFRKGLMALSASEIYVDWLLGRHLGERDRGPAYERIKAIFARRLSPEMGRVNLPGPAWAPGHAPRASVRA